jgi:alcohol dehydrogenase, propanol-preferring
VRAAILAERARLEVRDMPDPAPDGWAVVQVRAAGVCGTELHFLDAMLEPPRYPFVLGHEAAGVVAEAPPGASVAAGDRVAVYNFVGCRICHWCRTGREELCLTPTGQLGFSLDGGFSDLVRVPAENLIPLPEGVSYETGAVLSCSGMSAVHAVRLADLRLGQTAIVNGVGGVGLMVVQVAAAAGARVIAVADAGAKAPLARDAGAAEVVVLEGGRGYEELPARIRELTGGAGADHYFELVGSQETMRAGIGSLGRAGTCVLIGYTGDDLVVNPVELILSELRVLASVAAARHDLETAIRLAGEGRLEVLIDTRYPLEDIQTPLERLRARQVHGRNVLVWD